MPAHAARETMQAREIGGTMDAQTHENVLAAMHGEAYPTCAICCSRRRRASAAAPGWPRCSRGSLPREHAKTLEGALHLDERWDLLAALAGP
jgi:hypothetical protein